MHAGGESDRTGPLPRAVHGARCRVLRVLQHLTLGGPRITQQQHVDVSTDAVFVAYVLGHRSDAGRDAGYDPLPDLGIARQFEYLCLIPLGEVGGGRRVLLSAHVVGVYEGEEDGESTLLREVVVVAVGVHAGDLHLGEYDLLGSGHASGWDRPRSLLQIDLLIIPVLGSSGVDTEGSKGVAGGAGAGLMQRRGRIRGGMVVDRCVRIDEM